jgi:hypothetical protein
VSKNQQQNKASCPLCGSVELTDFLTLEQVPVSVGILWPTQSAAQAAPQGTIQLAFCRRCGFVYNRAFDPTQLLYKPGYEVSLHHSPRYRAFLAETASGLIERYNIRHETVLEVGCGKGVFLRLLCQLGNNNGFGFDPALLEEGEESIGNQKITWMRDYYTARYAHLPHALLCCRHVLNQLADPRQFLLDLRQVLGKQTDTVLYFELPNGEQIFQGAATWNVFYERASYFSTERLVQLFLDCGFDVLRAGPCYADGQYLSIEAKGRPVDEMLVTPVIDAKSNEIRPLPARLTGYASYLQSHIARWQEELMALQKAGRRIIGWGSGGQGITFLNLLQTGDQIAYVVDINPDRQGLFIPGTGQQVVAPEALRQELPNLVLITNATYADEIQHQVSEMGLQCEFLVT